MFSFHETRAMPNSEVNRARRLIIAAVTAAALSEDQTSVWETVCQAFAERLGHVPSVIGRARCITNILSRGDIRNRPRWARRSA